jgi:hypothetical protein
LTAPAVVSNIPAIQADLKPESKTVMPERIEDVFDDRGRRIGTVARRALGRHHAEFWKAEALDGVDLGSYARRVDAESAIWDDFVDGMPRSPRSQSQKFRPVVDGHAVEPIRVVERYPIGG